MPSFGSRLKPYFMNLHRFFFLCLTACISIHAAAADYLQGRLNNGLRYHILPTGEHNGRLAVQLQVEVGAADEENGEEGMAHMVEHMNFRSSPAYPQGIAAQLSAQSWQMGRHFNAQTTYDYTRYLLLPPRGNRELEDSLTITAEILRPRQFKPSDWQIEQKTVLNEWRNRQNAENRLTLKRNAPLLQGSRHGRYPPIGGETAIRTAEAGQLSRFHNKWYAPNNAVILITGDIDPQTIQRELTKRLGDLQHITLPTRCGIECEPPLQNSWRSATVQDAENGDSSLDLVFRFRNPSSRRADSEGEYQRLLDNFAAYIIESRLKKQTLPPAILSLSLHSGNLARQTGSISISAATTPDGHRSALHTLLNLRRSILAEPATEEEIAAYRRRFAQNTPISATSVLPQNLTAALQDADRGIFRQQSWQNRAEYNKTVRQQLYRIDSKAVNWRIREWLDADDKLAVARAPGNRKPELPDSSRFEQFAASALHPAQTATSQPNRREKKNKLSSAAKKTVRPDDGAMPLLPQNRPSADGSPFYAPIPGQVLNSRFDHPNKVAYYQLSNGDQAVILQHPSAGDRVYFQALSEGGYMQSTLNPLQAKLAAELLWQQMPDKWQQWSRLHGLGLNYRLDSHSQSVSGDVPYVRLGELLRLYRAYYIQPEFNERWKGHLQNAAQRLSVRRQSPTGRKDVAAALLYYGRAEYSEPDAQTVATFDRNELLRQWQRLGTTRTNYYLVSSQQPERIKPMLEQYLASIPRRPAAHTHLTPASGNRTVRIHENDSARSDVLIRSWQPFYNWTPETSEQIPLLANLATARLKAALRDREQGVYSLQFSVRPLPHLNRIESELSFNTDPARADQLVQAALHILEQMPENISKTESDNLRRLFVEQEALRRRDPKAWLERLMQSHRKYGDARYLKQLPDLHYSIIQTRLRHTVKLLWASHNTRILINAPKKP